MSMGFDEIRQIVEGRLSEWLESPIRWDNLDGAMYTQAAIDNRFDELEIGDKWPGAETGATANSKTLSEYDVPWIRLTIQHGDSMVASIGTSPEVRRTGLVDIQILAPKHKGSASAYQLADKVADIIQFYRSGHLETMASSVERVGKEEDWYNLLVSTPFRAGC